MNLVLVYACTDIFPHKKNSLIFHANNIQKGYVCEYLGLNAMNWIFEAINSFGIKITEVYMEANQKDRKIIN